MGLWSDSGGTTAGAVGAAGQISSDLIGSIAAMIAAGKESQASKMARGKWDRLKVPAAELLSQLYYNPTAERWAAPYTPASKSQEQWNKEFAKSNKKPNRDSYYQDELGQYEKDLAAWTANNASGINGGIPANKSFEAGQGTYKWAPSSAMQNLYSGYLNRQYGLSGDVAGSMVAQSLAPIKMGQIKGNLSSAGANRSNQMDAGAIANAGMGVQAPGALRAQSYLQDSTKLAAFNLWRAQQLGSTIG
jgi:hypothetical protein